MLDPQGKTQACSRSWDLSYSAVYMTVIVAEVTLHRNSKSLLCPKVSNSQDRRGEGAEEEVGVQRVSINGLPKETDGGCGRGRSASSH